MVPIMVQNLMLALVAVADAFMLGGLDQNYMSAVSLATQIQFIQNMFLSAATAGLAILGAQYWGKQDIKALDDIFGLAIRICGIVSVLFFVACAFFPTISDAYFHKRAGAYRLWCKLSENSFFFIFIDRFFTMLYSHDEDFRARGYCGCGQLYYSTYKYRAECGIYLWGIWHREHECEGSGTRNAYI